MKKNKSSVFCASAGFFLITAVMFFPFFGEAQNAQHPPLPAPMIVIQPDIYYPQDEILYIEGRGVPRSLVELRMQKQGARPLTFTIKTDSNGEWSLAERVPLEEGEWEMRARTQDTEGVVSDWSSPRVFRSVSTGFTIGGLTIKFAFLSLIILSLIIAGGLLVWYFLIRVRRLRYLLLIKEVREAKDVARENLTRLRGELLEELRLMTAPGKALSQEDISRKERVFRDLDDIERRMEKEIDDIQEHA